MALAVAVERVAVAAARMAAAAQEDEGQYAPADMAMLRLQMPLLKQVCCGCSGWRGAGLVGQGSYWVGMPCPCRRGRTPQLP